MNSEERKFYREMTANSLANELTKILKYYMAV